MKHFAIICLVLFTISARAQWNDSSTVNTPVCTYASPKSMLRIASDSAGGAILAWVDTRGTQQIFLQRVSADGYRLWSPAAVRACDTCTIAVLDSTIDDMTILSDERNGLYIYWSFIGDNFLMEFGSVLQHIDSQGSVQMGPSGNSPIGCSSRAPAGVCQTGKSGMWFVWEACDFQTNLYAQRSDSNGIIHSFVHLDLVDPGTFGPCALSDRRGGAFILYDRQKISQGDGKLHVLRLDSTGTKMWGSTGVPLVSISNLISPFVSEDGGVLTGLVIGRSSYQKSWTDYYVQKLDSSGRVLWGVNGIFLCDDTTRYTVKQVVTDGAGGALALILKDSAEILVQRINDAGMPQWPQPGVVIASGLVGRGDPVMTSDGVGGAIVTWSDKRNGNADIFAQRISRSGQTPWKVNGLTISNAAGDQTQPQIVTDMRYGAILAWLDGRNPATSFVYAARIDSNGIIMPVELSSLTAKRRAIDVRLD